ncbi:hypothetical protein FB451DRAFT_154197 [Mycena latifolia]|nr:hypothetical protein FB451DRAFT_154197 [Mycena latifolia]
MATVSSNDSIPVQGNTNDEAASAKLWAVYISEAEKYDKALVESWKSDMEGMLIFAGLFSASLTAFIIESYKTLTTDPGDSTVQLLAQISQQLAAAADGNTFIMPAPTHFTPPATSLVCNAFWFISLGLSLTCALIATLLEQWARDFLHKADMRSAPLIRARIFAYLYYGLQRFNMHTVVDIIPLLLHASLLFFFAGLVAFLIPINRIMTIVAAALLVVVLGVYSLLTFLPLWYSDCPYHTPLSGAFWRISRSISMIWNRHHKGTENTLVDSPIETMVEVMAHRAMEVSPTRMARDYRALVWTFKSLADDIELEPFMEAIPDVLWGPYGERYTFEDQIYNLVCDPELDFLPRLQGFLLSCGNGLLSLEASKRRRMTCFKVLWHIAFVASSSSRRQPLDFSRVDFRHLRDGDGIEHYSISALVLIKWSTFCSIKSRIAEMTKHLAQCEADVQAGRAPNLALIISYLNFAWNCSLPFKMDQRIWNPIIGDGPGDISLPLLLQICGESMKDLGTTTPHRILFDYLQHAATFESPPYQWSTTLIYITLDQSALFSAMKDDLEMTLDIIVRSHLDRLNEATTIHWVDEIIKILYYWWKPDPVR